MSGVALPVCNIALVVLSNKIVGKNLKTEKENLKSGGYQRNFSNVEFNICFLFKPIIFTPWLVTNHNINIIQFHMFSYQTQSNFEFFNLSPVS